MDLRRVPSEADFRPTLPPALAAALEGLEALGPKPPRRRPAFTWEKEVARLRAIVEKETPAYNALLTAKGHCRKCGSHIGQGLWSHERYCKRERLHLTEPGK